MALVSDKPRKKAGRPKSGRKTANIFTRVDKDIADALEQFIEHFNTDNDIKTEKGAHIQKALKMYLIANNFWPPPK